MEATTTDAVFFFDTSNAFHREFAQSEAPSAPGASSTRATSTTFDPSMNGRCFQDCWRRVQEETNKICERLNEDVFHKISRFLLQPESSSERLMRVAVAIAGINLSDNEKTLQSLSLRLQQDLNARVSTIGPWICSSTSSAVRSFVEDFVTGDAVVLKEDGADVEGRKLERVSRAGLRESTKLQKDLSLKAEAATSALVKSGKQTFSRKTVMSSMAPMQILEEWYNEVAKGNPLVLVIEDAESIAEDVLGQLVDICAVYYRDKAIEISVILGMTGKSVGAHGIFSCEQTSRLRLSNFKLIAAKHVVDELMNRLIVQEALPVRLEPTVISHLYDRFLSSDSSIFNFLQALKVALMDHFCTVATAFLSMFKSADDPALEDACKPCQLPVEDVRSAIRENQELRSAIRPFLLACIIQTGKFMKLTQIIRKRPLEVFIDVCDVMGSIRRKSKPKSGRKKPTAVDLGLITLIRQRLCLSGIDTWAELLGLWNELLAGQQQSSLRLSSALEELKGLIDRTESDETHSEETKSEELTDESMKNWSKRKRRDTLLKAVQPVHVQKNEEFIKKALKWWDALIRMWNMDNPYTNAFECADTFNSVKNITNAAPRRSILKALVQPHRVLGCKCCGTRSLDESKASMPAVCIALKHFNLQKSLKGRQHRIAVSEWYEDFAQTLASPKARGKENENQDSKEAVQLSKARFVQAITELKTMGFLKQSRKKDFVNSILYFVYQE